MIDVNYKEIRYEYHVTDETGSAVNDAFDILFELLEAQDDEQSTSDRK